MPIRSIVLSSGVRSSESSSCISTSSLASFATLVYPFVHMPERWVMRVAIFPRSQRRLSAALWSQRLRFLRMMHRRAWIAVERKAEGAMLARSEMCTLDAMQPKARQAGPVGKADGGGCHRSITERSERGKCSAFGFCSRCVIRISSLSTHFHLL